MGGCETTPPDLRTTRETAPATPAPHPQPGRKPSSLAIIGRRLRTSSSFVLARALTGANGCGRSSLTCGRAAARNTAAAREASTTTSPAISPGHRDRPARPLDSDSPHGRLICALRPCEPPHTARHTESATCLDRDPRPVRSFTFCSRRDGRVVWPLLAGGPVRLGAGAVSAGWRLRRSGPGSSPS